MARRAHSAPASKATPRPVGDLTAYIFEVCGEAAAEPRFRAALEEGLPLALTHRSYAYEAGGIPHNERLEFLGDSVLGLVVTDALYCTHPDVPEGQAGPAACRGGELEGTGHGGPHDRRGGVSAARSR